MRFSGDASVRQRIVLTLGSSWFCARALWLALYAVAGWGLLGSAAQGQMTLRIEDYAAMPQTGSSSSQLARVNFLREEPGDTGRFFVNDLNGPLYILDKDTKEFHNYLNFNGSTGPGMFNQFTLSPGFAAGLVTFQFDPDYVNNGKFYTVHQELPLGMGGSSSDLVPKTGSVPGLDTTGYTSTSAVISPGNNNRQYVLIEWTDTDPTNYTFTGTARELLRISGHSQIHPLGDLIFNPTAGPEDPDWRVMYLASGDGGSGEQQSGGIFQGTRRSPQRLDSLAGKVLRIIPDLDEHVDSSTVSANGRYRVPDDNPYLHIAQARPEIWAVGLRNPHRFNWDVDPEDPDNNHLFINDIGLFHWEEVNIIHRGANYGYSAREGNEVLVNNDQTEPLPVNDTIPIRTGSNSTAGSITPTYPVIQYSHAREGQPTDIAGDAIAGGFVYRGSRIPELYGKYVFGDITTATLYYAELEDMLAADDGDPNTMAPVFNIDIMWENPNRPEQGELLYTTTTIETPDATNTIRRWGPVFEIVSEAYIDRGGTLEEGRLPGGANITGNRGRADIRFALDADGELYIVSKSDGMIRAIMSAVVDGPPPLWGDYNDDGLVDAADYTFWRDNAGTMVELANDEIGGEIGAAQFEQWRDQFGASLDAAEAATALVPEPAAATLLVAGWLVAGSLVRRRR